MNILEYKENKTIDFLTRIYIHLRTKYYVSNFDVEKVNHGFAFMHGI